LVVNYDLTKDPDTYVHRSGRTGRAGKNGIAYTLCAEFDQQPLDAIEQFLGKAMTVYTEHPYHFDVLADRYKSLFGFSRKQPVSSGSGLIGARGGAKRSNRRNRSSGNR